MGLPFVPLGAGEPVGASAKSAPAQAQRLARPGIYLVRVPKPDFDETALQAKQAQFQAIQEKLRQGNSGQEGKASNRSKRDAVLVGAGVCVGAQCGGRGDGKGICQWTRALAAEGKEAQGALALAGPRAQHDGAGRRRHQLPAQWACPHPQLASMGMPFCALTPSSVPCAQGDTGMLACTRAHAHA